MNFLLDIAFTALTLGFFLLSFGLVALCARLMAAGT